MRAVRWIAVSTLFFVAACSGGGGSSGGGDAGAGGSTPPPAPPPVADSTFETSDSTARFLSQATFGATSGDINNLTGANASKWLVAEFNKPATTNLDFVLDFLDQPGNRNPDGFVTYEGGFGASHSFWINAVEADDQLRQRTAFALSQIFVVSNNGVLFDYPLTMAHFQDVLVNNAFGNFRDLIEDVTYSPAMGVYLTYWQNQKEDPSTGRMPDENYAREIMQLFTIGLVELNLDGTARTGGSGDALETYNNDDVTGLAKVFTGLSLNDEHFFEWPGGVEETSLYSPMIAFPQFHSSSEKSFLGTTIPADTSAEDSIDQALDTLFNHPNVAPFIGRQLIQRLTTSNPSPAYVERVATAFETGTYTLPDDTVVGTGERGDMQATIAAILMDAEARAAPETKADDQGKIREPILRFVQWARAFDADTVTPQYSYPLWDTSPAGALAQHPYRSPSVFNFYRPGYVAPGTLSGAAGLTVPELQIMNASSVTGYVNFMSYYIFGFPAEDDDPNFANSFRPDYSDELLLVQDVSALTDHLDLLLAAGALSDSTKQDIISMVEGIPLESESDENYDGPALRVATAILMVMTAPDYLVQQ